MPNPNKREEWIKILEIVQGVGHDYTFEYRDLERMFNDGFEMCRKTIIVELLNERKNENLNAPKD